MGPVLLWSGLPRGFHRWLGKIYGLSVLGWAGPSGFYLSFHAKGGLAGQSCFLILTVLWWVTTALGVRAIRAKRLAEHRRWMLRSYAVALSAMTFRVFQVAFFHAGVGDDANYAVSLWLSLATSVASGEWLALRSPDQGETA
jgi:uncharacterized membrane protein